MPRLKIERWFFAAVAECLSMVLHSAGAAAKHFADLMRRRDNDLS